MGKQSDAHVPLAINSESPEDYCKVTDLSAGEITWMVKRRVPNTVENLRHERRHIRVIYGHTSRAIYYRAKDTWLNICCPNPDQMPLFLQIGGLVELPPTLPVHE